MLNVAVSGHTGTSYETSSRCVASLWQDSEFENLRNVNVTAHRSDSSSSTSSIDRNKQSPNDKKQDSDPVKLAARLVCL
jgi:hypothetical protein